MSVSDEGSECAPVPGAMRGRAGHAVPSEETDGDGVSE